MFKGQIALVTGGADGIGFDYVKQLLENGIKGVSLVDVNTDNGKAAEETLNAKFGPKKVLFLHADVSQQNQLEDVFKRSFDYWKGLDILINNAGIVNEKEWEKTISVNCMATVKGTYLGFEYMSKLKGGKGGVIVNVASITGIEHCFTSPTYSASKSFVITFTRSLGHDAYYAHNEVRVLSICPGLTKTAIIESIPKNTLTNLCSDMAERTFESINTFSLQSKEHVAKCLIDIISKKEKSGSIWVIEDGELPYEVQEAPKLSLRKF